MTLLSVRNLTTVFSSGNRRVTAVDGVSFDIPPGTVFGFVGESGSGKSATCRSILRLFSGSRAAIEDGEILLRGRDLARLDERAMAGVRGQDIAMIFQDPMTALNPTMRIGSQIAEGLRLHRRLSRAEARRQAVAALESVGVPSARKRIDSYPHEFSGGMRQRVLIAIALACRPNLLIADEPTTALDVTIQDQILKLILNLRADFGMSVLLVTHDLGVVAQTCDRVAVMYAGQIVEEADTAALFRHPRHPYTQALLGAMPTSQTNGALKSISGSPPDLAAPPPGCPFQARCEVARDACRAARPPLDTVEGDHRSACIRWREVT